MSHCVGEKISVPLILPLLPPPVPCPPSGLVTYRACSSNVIIFGWDPTNNTGYYVATALASNGEVTECRTTDTSCFFTNTGCGRSYQYTVYSVSGLCNSVTSPPAHVRTGMCSMA